jgi:4-hydroxybenzoyl-CoA thioesterase
VPRVRIDFPQESLFAVDLTVRAADLNYANHLDHARLISLLHEARVRLLHANGLGEIDADGRVITVADLAVSYRAEAFLGDLLRVEVAAAELGSRGCVLLYRVRRGDTVVALARTGIVVVDAKRGRVTTMPEPLLRALQGGAS